LASYLHLEDCPISPKKLLRSLNINLLYDSARQDPSLDFKKIYNLVIDSQLLVSSKSSTVQREYTRFTGYLAILLFKNKE
jgi:hypothetical protein